MRSLFRWLLGIDALERKVDEQQSEIYRLQNSVFMLELASKSA